jgi:hypothetical protein
MKRLNKSVENDMIKCKVWLVIWLLGSLLNAFAAEQADNKIITPLEAQIKGKVIDRSSGEVVAGVIVTVAPESYTGSLERFLCVSGKDGTFHIGGLRSGRYKVMVDDHSLDVRIESGESVKEVIIECTAVVHGKVMDPNSKPIADAQIQIREHNPGATGIAAPDTRTDKEGHYRYTQIKWPYRVGVIWRKELPAGEERWQYLRRNQVFKGSQTVDFQFGDFPAADSVLCGQVVEKDGEVIQEFTIDVQLKVDFSDYSTKYLQQFGVKVPFSTADGRFETRALPAGKYTVLATPKNARAYDYLNWQDCKLVDKERTEIKIEIARKKVLYGRVLFEDDSPAVIKPPPWAGARTSITQWNVDLPMGSRIGEVDDDGFFELYLSQEELEQLKTGKSWLSIDIPTDEQGSRKQVGIFPFGLLATEKNKAGVVEIKRPLWKPVSLVGKVLPGFDSVKIDFSPEQAKDRMILVCFWDMNQRPSRQCITKLAEQAKQLKEKGITVITIQGTKVDEAALNEWIKKYNISFAVGMIAGKEEEVHLAWGVKALPWLILTDRKHVVIAEGFSFAELDEKIK